MTVDQIVVTELDNLSKLSERSRAFLKKFFEETDAFRLAVGRTTVAFTESQVYNLLRVLTDETIRMSYSTMERMFTDSVKGTPITGPSRTAQFRSRDRAQIPGTWVHGSSTSSESDSDVPFEVGIERS